VIITIEKDSVSYIDTSIPLCLRLKRVAIMKLHEMRPEET